jgi:NADPH:quinone reductase
MRAVLCESFEGIGALRFAETAEPRPVDVEVMIDVHAACVSYMDYVMICGGYQLRPALPYVPGTDAAGVVVAVGDKVERFRRGDRLACANWFGGFAERMVAKASKSARIPNKVDFAVGSTVLQAYLNAWYALVERTRLQPGETVLITGAAGGVGLACVEVARLLGGRVIAAVGSGSKSKAARDSGAEHVIDYSSETSANA